MKRITLTIVAIAAASSAALAQDPTPPVPPTTPVPRPMPAPRAETVRPMLWTTTPAPMDKPYIDRAEIEAMKANFDVDRAHFKAMADFATTVKPMGDWAPMVKIAAMPPMPSMAFGWADRFGHNTPPAPWAQGDPADSVYRVARDLLTRGEYGRSARMFADIQKNYSNSAYKTAAQYWEAFARYKIGTTDELRQAAKVLEPIATKIVPGTNSNYTVDRRTSDNDITTLYARINGALAMRGDADAAARVQQAAKARGSACDEEDQQLQSEALNALSQVDPSSALPILRKVLDRKDDCSANLRRNAVFIIGRRADAESGTTLLSVAKNDPNMSVRAEAVSALGRIPGDAGISALEDILRNEQEERLQRAAVSALMRSDNPKARASMRALIDRKDAPVNLRIEAVNSFNSERATTDDAAYLRTLFTRAESDQFKIAIIGAVARIGGPENDQWVLSIAKNPGESSSVRSSAINRFTRSNTVTVADLSKLYDASAESYEIRSRIINMLGNRKEPEAADKLYDIARSSTVINHRMQALNALSNKKDPRATKLLEDILDGKKP